MTSISAETVPDLLTMSPAYAKRAWEQWLADRDHFTEVVAVAISFISPAINEWALNFRKDAEEVSRKNLARRLTELKAALTTGCDK